MTTVADLLAGSGLPRLEARALLAHATGRAREELVAWPERAVEAPLARRFLAMAARRREGEPLAYLLGEREFLGRSFLVDAAVLVPRPETELLVALAIRTAAGKPARILDLGTGSGCIAISLALALPLARVHATDVSAAALVVAEKNAHRLGAEVRFAAGEWFAAVEGRFDVITSNPPYVAEADPYWEGLRFEPRLALAAGPDGLACFREIVALAPTYLAENGMLLVEHGYDQGPAIRQLFAAAGFADVATERDAAGLERATVGRTAARQPQSDQPSSL